MADRTSLKTIGISAPEYNPRLHTEWTFRMRAYLRKHYILGSQITEGEIASPLTADDEPLRRRDSNASLAMQRSTSYTLTSTDQLSDVLAEASADESSGESSSTYTEEESDDTIPYSGSSQPSAPAPGPDRVQPNSSADVQARDPEADAEEEAC